jgi:hypothetical protein
MMRWLKDDELEEGYWAGGKTMCWWKNDMLVEG